MRQSLENMVVRIGEGEKGFTLIEMLVVVGIIVALAAVIVPTVIKFTSEGETGAQNAEWDAVQVAVDIMMADTKIAVINAGGTAAKITDTFDFGVGTSTQTLSGYLRDASTKYCYTWDGTGKVLTQTAC